MESTQLEWSGVVECLQMCKTLYTRIVENKRMIAVIHSRFDKAVNFQLEDGTIITILNVNKSLQPNSMVINTFQLLSKTILPDEVLLSKEGVFSAEKRIISFEDTEIIDMNIKSEPYASEKNIELIREFLLINSEKGICGLANNINNNVYTEFLIPRINEFRKAIKINLLDKMNTAVERLAGCGPGLTPSSDDFLCGYISSFALDDINCRLRKEIAWTAAGKTNDVSASLLKCAGKGLFSYDILKLFEAMNGEDESEIENALRRVANFGSSSGCDFLTGLYFGLIDRM